VGGLEASLASAQSTAQTASDAHASQLLALRASLREEAARTAEALQRSAVVEAALAERTRELASEQREAQQAAAAAAAAAAAQQRQLAAARRQAEDVEASSAAAARSAEGALLLESQRAAAAAAGELEHRGACERAEARLAAAQRATGECEARCAAVCRRADAAEADAADAPQLRARCADLQAGLAALRAEAQARDGELSAARRAQGAASQVELLREQLRSAETRAQRCQDAASAAEKALALERQQRGGAAAVGGGAGAAAAAAACPASPGDAGGAATELALLRRQLAAAAAAKGEAEASTSGARAALRCCEQQRDDALAAAAAHAAAAESGRSSLARCQARARLLTEERDSLQRFLKAYDEDAAAQQQPQQAGPAGADAAALARERAVREARQEELGAALGRAHERVCALEQECQAAQRQAMDACAARDGALAAASKAAARAASAEREAHALGRDCAGLQERLGRGEFDVERYKVLHLRHNPEVACKEEAQAATQLALRTENDELRAALQRLEAHAGGAAAAPPQQQQQQQPASTAAAVAAAEATVLRRKVADLEKREARYKAVFQESIATVRDACRLIFGYHLELALPGDTVTVRSVLCASDQEVLVFKLAKADPAQGRDAEATLLPGALAARPDVKRQVDVFIGRCRSVPAFLANVFLESFNQQTLG